MAQSLFTSETPAAEGSDGSPGITTGTTFRSAVDGTVTHIRFYVGASVSGTYTGLLWVRTANDTGSGGAGTELASKAYPGTPATSSWNLIELDTPVAITAGITYRVGRFHASDYVFTNGFFATALTTDDLTADENGETGQHLGLISQGTFLIDAAPGYPRQVGSSASYFVDIVFVPDSDPAEGTAALGLDLAVAAAGAVTAQGAAALGLELAVAASGTMTAQGAADLGLDLAVSATGARAAGGTSALGLDLALAATGARSAGGSAALELVLTVSASGSNGDVGCPIEPWPWIPSPAAGYPWSPRAVKSFPGGDC